MTAIDTWIAQLVGTKGAQPIQPLYSQIDVVVAALTLLNGLVPSGGVTAQGVLFGSTGASPVVTQSNKFSFDGSNLTINTGGVVAADAQLVISANAVATLTGSPNAAVAHFVGPSGTQQASILIDTFGTTGAANYGNIGSSVLCRTAGGTIAVPSAMGNNRALGGIHGIGFGATAYSVAPRAEIIMYAGENWSDTAQGAYIGFYTTQNTTLTTALNMTLDQVGNLVIAGTLVVGSAATPFQSSVALTNNAGAGAGTLTNAPAAGNPTKWIKLNDNGTARFIPCW